MNIYDAMRFIRSEYDKYVAGCNPDDDLPVLSFFAWLDVSACFIDTWRELFPPSYDFRYDTITHAYFAPTP